eukprot:gene6647-3303_t
MMSKTETLIYQQVVVSMLCRAMKSYNVEVRSTSVSYLQRSVVAAEKLAIPAETVLQSLLKLILPMTAELVKIAGAGGATSRDCPQADLTTRELVRAVVKVVLLYADRLQQLPNFCTAWRTVLDTMGQVMTVGKSSEALTEAVPEALKNMLLVLQDKGCLKVGWKDTDGTDMPHGPYWSDGPARITPGACSELDSEAHTTFTSRINP